MSLGSVASCEAAIRLSMDNETYRWSPPGFFTSHTFFYKQKTKTFSSLEEKKKTISRKPIEENRWRNFHSLRRQKSQGESENFSMSFVHENSFCSHVSNSPEGKKSDLWFWERLNGRSSARQKNHHKFPFHHFWHHQFAYGKETAETNLSLPISASIHNATHTKTPPSSSSPSLPFLCNKKKCCAKTSQKTKRRMKKEKKQRNFLHHSWFPFAPS